MESIIWFLITGALFFFMMKFGCGSHMGGHGGHEGHGGDSSDKKTSGGVSSAALKIKDPVCGMEIDERQAYGMIRKNDRQIYFCSEKCAGKFNAEPDKYL